MPFALVTLGLLSLLAFSIYFLRRSLRGRPVGDHPTCSRCSFDLFNRPETSTRCPECGSDLTIPRAILPGTRRRNAAFILASLSLLLVTLAASVDLAYRLVVDPRLIPLQPTFLLPLHFRYGPLSAQALGELQSRILTNRAPASAASSVVARILSLQADPTATWDPKHGNFVEALRQFKSLPDSDWVSYLRNSALITGRIRPDVRTGDPVPFELTISARVGRALSIRTVCSGSITFDDQPQRRPSQWGNPWFDLSPDFPYPVQHSALAEHYAGLPPGLHTAHLSVELALGVPADSPLTVRRSLDLPFTLHPADHPTVRVIHDPKLRDQIAQSILVRVTQSGSSRRYPMFALTAPTSPCALSYDVTFRSDTKEIGRSSFAIAKGSRNGYVVSPYTPLPDHIDLILRPNPDRAVGTVDIVEISAGDIILPKVPTAPTRSYAPTPVLPQLPTTRP